MTNTGTALSSAAGSPARWPLWRYRKRASRPPSTRPTTPTAGGVGGGLSIAANGQNALGVVGADEVVRRIGTPTTAMVIQSWTGKQLGEFGGLTGLPVTQFVWRADLHQGLYDEAARRGIRTEHGKRLVSAANNGHRV